MMNRKSKGKYNFQSFGENKTGYRAENIKGVSRDENHKKSPHLLALYFIPS